MNAITHNSEPWTLAEGKTLSDLLELKLNRTTGGCEWRRFHCDLTEQERLDAAAWLVASEIMGLRFNRQREHFHLWERMAKGEVPPNEVDLEVLKPFIEPSFGLPPEGIDTAHTQAHVAEVVWRMLAKEQTSPDRELVYLTRPDPDVHAPGADGFALYKEGDRYIYRLWEIKKKEGDGALSGTISTAYSQLKAHAERYLAKLTGASEVDEDDPLNLPIANLVMNWKAGDSSAGVGIAVAANAATLPQTAFSTMHEHFPDLAEGCLEGCLIGLGDLAEFCTYVRRLIWNGLSTQTP
jgi:hypothetical protein